MRQAAGHRYPVLYKFGVRIWLLFTIEKFGVRAPFGIQTDPLPENALFVTLEAKPILFIGL
jgi:hypothetical protein